MAGSLPKQNMSQDNMSLERHAFMPPEMVDVERKLYHPHCPQCGETENIEVASGHGADLVELQSEGNRAVVDGCNECGYKKAA